ncbi:MAG: WecB/TagA/CpsF family glycosyltransferase [Pseudomonadota bacterium]
MDRKRVAHTTVAGVPVAISSEADLAAILVEDAKRNRDGDLASAQTMLSCNGQSLSLFAKDRAFAQAIERADLVHADGQFIVWMSRLFGKAAVPERTATTDLIHAAAQAAADNGLSFYLLGSGEDVNRDCAAELTRRYPGLRIAGRRNGYFADEDVDAIVADINASGADFLWVGLGKPKEQIFAEHQKANLNCAWIVSCGGCFHFVVGDYARAPEWMQRSGMEWLHRLMSRPKQLLGRYLYTVPHAIGLVLWHGLTSKSRERAQG